MGLTEILTLTLFPIACTHTPCPSILDALVALRNKFPVEGILMSKTDVADAFRNVRIEPDQAHNFRYTVGDLVVIDFD